MNSYDPAPSVTFNASRIDENSATSHAHSYTSATDILPLEQLQNFGHTHITSTNEFKIIREKLLRDIFLDVSYGVFNARIERY